MKSSFSSSRTFGYLLNALLPGAGHMLWRELLFGLFVFLIMMLAVAIFMVQYLLPLPRLATWLLLGLPIVFYAFTFVDLSKTMSSKRAGFTPRRVTAIAILVIGLTYQVAAPSAPVNFMLRNFPDVFVIPDSHLSPLYSRGDITTASRMAYSVQVPFLSKPMYHSLPERYDLIRFVSESGQRTNGFVLGLPGEEVEISAGTLVVSGVPMNNRLPAGFALTGDWPLTPVQTYSILVATFNLGTLAGLEQIQLGEVVGRIDRFH